MHVKRWMLVMLAMVIGWGSAAPAEDAAQAATPLDSSAWLGEPEAGALAAKRKKKRTATPEPAGQPGGSGQVAQSAGSSSPSAGDDASRRPPAPRAPSPRAPGDPFLLLLHTGFSSPIQITNAGDGSNRLFVVERGGRIKVIKNGQILATPYLDLSGVVTQTGGEQGLLSLAFHPQFGSNGQFFVWYTDKNAVPGNTGTNTLARYTVSNPSSDVASVTASTVLLAEVDRAGNHNGGMITFDRNADPGSRLLYLSIGDEGGGGDQFERGQDLCTYFGKILRIDVNSSPDPGLAYKIPTSNPFFSSSHFCANPLLSVKKEIWSYGLRNPWRTSFDRQTGDFYIGDVGQGSFEEIDFEPASSPGGVNYGWKIKEGKSCFNPVFPFTPPLASCNSSGLTDPVLDYPRSSGISVTGGYVYRGTNYPALQGSYFYADFGAGTIWKTQKPVSGAWPNTVFLNSGQNVSSFGEDEAGELYVVGLGGAILKLADPTCSPRPNVLVSVTPGPTGRLTATLRAGTGPGAPDNQLLSYQLTQLDNAVVGIAGNDNITAPTTITLPAGTQQTTFTIRRPASPPPGAGSTVHLTVNDACGAWPTFVGGGAGSF